MSNTIIAGKPSNTFGDKDSQLILRGSSIKIQWGNKFIDVIKNGKLNTEIPSILHSVNSEDEIKENGIYLINEQVCININGNKKYLDIAGDTAYVSFLTKQENINQDQKQQALQNIGFYYNSIEDVKNSGITTGIVYVTSENKLYVVNQNQLIEYTQFNKQYQTPEESLKLYIENYSLKINDISYITLQDLNTTFHTQVVLEKDLVSNVGNSESGFKLGTQNGQSCLDVNTINCVNIPWVKELIDQYLPIGVIVAINDKNNIPKGWAEYDGQNGTPDLTGGSLTYMIRTGNFDNISEEVDKQLEN